MTPRPASLPSRAAGLAAALAACAAPAKEAYDYLVYDVGPVTLRPQVDILSTFNSNVFYQEDDQEADLVTTFRPGLRVLYGYLDANHVSVEYAPSALVYAGNSELNDLGHVAKLLASYKTARATFTANGAFEQQDALLGGFFGRIQSSVDRLQYDQQAGARYDISPKTIVALSGTVELTDYTFDFGSLPPGQRTYLYDGFGWTIAGSAGYVLRDRITVFPTVTYGQFSNSPNAAFDPLNPTTYPSPDLELYNFGLRVEGEFTPRLSGSAQFGYELRNYLDSFIRLVGIVTDPVTGQPVAVFERYDEDAPGGMVANASLTYLASPKGTATLTYQRRFTLSREVSNSAYTADTVSLGYQHQLGTRGKWLAGLSFSFTSNAYDDVGTFRGRTDYLYFARADVAYRIQPWITLGLSQDYQTVTSSSATVSEYDIFRTGFRLFIGF